ncbi:uncharacterized protein LOC144926045 [Branchiostoma floridae x Branchiostoma belcheri]
MIRSKRKKSTNVVDKRSGTSGPSLAGPTETDLNTKDADPIQAARSPERRAYPVSNGDIDGHHLDINDLQGTGPGVPPPPYPGKSGVSLSPSSIASAIRRRLFQSKEAKHGHFPHSSVHGQSLTPLPEDGYNENGEQVGDRNLRSRLGQHISRSRQRITRSRNLIRARSTSSLAEVEDGQNIDKPEQRLYVPNRIDENHNRPIHRARSLVSLSEEGYLQEQRNKTAVTYSQNSEQQDKCNSPVFQRLSRSRERVIEHSRRLMRTRSASSLVESDDDQNNDKSEDGIYLIPRPSHSTEVNQNGPIHRAQSLVSLSEANCSHKGQQQVNGKQLGESSPGVTRHISRSRERIQHNRKLMRSRSSSSLAASDDEQNLNNLEDTAEPCPHLMDNHSTDFNQNRWHMTSEVDGEHAVAARGYMEEINKLRAQLTELQAENTSLQTITNKMKREDGAVQKEKEELQEENRSLKTLTNKMKMEEGLLQKTKGELQKVLTEKKQLQQAHEKMELELTQYRKNAELQNNAHSDDSSQQELGKSQLSKMIASDGFIKRGDDLEREIQETARGKVDLTDVLESKLSEIHTLLNGANERVKKLDEDRTNLLLQCKMQSHQLQQKEDLMRQLEAEISGLKEEAAKAMKVPPTADLAVQDMKTKDAVGERRGEMKDKAFTSELETDKLRRIVQELKDSHVKMRSENLSLQSTCEKQTRKVDAITKTYEEKEQTWKKEIEQLRLQVSEKISDENMVKERLEKKTKDEAYERLKSSEIELNQTRLELQSPKSTVKDIKNSPASLHSDHIKKMEEERRNFQLQLQQSNDHKTMLQGENTSLKEDVGDTAQRDDGKGGITMTKDIETTDLKIVKENLWGAITALDQEKKRAELEVIRQKTSRQEAERRVEKLKTEICRFEVTLESMQSKDATEKVLQIPVPSTASKERGDLEQELKMAKQNLERANADNQDLRRALKNTNEEVSQLKRNLHQLEEQLHTSGSETGKGSKFVQELKESHLAIRSENLRLQRECQKLASTIKGHEDTVRGLKEERDKLQKLTEDYPLLKDKHDRLHAIVQNMTEEKSTEIPKTQVTVMDTKIQDAKISKGAPNVGTCLKCSLKQTQGEASASELESDKLRRMVQDLKDRHIEMRSENLHLQSKCEKLSKELAAVVKRSGNNEQECQKPSQDAGISEMESNFAAIREENIRLQQQIEKSEKEIRNLTQESRNRAEDKNKTESKVQEFQIQLKEMQTKLAEIESEKLNLQQKIKEKESDNTKITAELTKRADEITKLSEQHREENIRLQQQIEKSEKEIRNLTHESRNRAEDKNKTESKMQEFQMQLKEMQTKLAEIKSEKLNLQQKIKEKESDNTKITAELTKRTDEITKLSEQHRSLESALNQTRLELQRSESKVKEVDHKLASELAERERAITKVNQELKENVKQAEEKYKKSTRILDSFYQEKLNLELEVQRLRNIEAALSKMDTQNSMLKQTIQDRENTITEVKKEMEDNARKAEEKYEKISATLDNAYQEQATLETKVQILERTEKELKEMETKKYMLEKTVKEREGTITKLKQELSENAQKAVEKYKKMSAISDSIYREKLNLELEVQRLRKIEITLDKFKTINSKLEQTIKERDSIITTVKQEMEDNARRAEEAEARYKSVEDKLHRNLKLVEEIKTEKEKDKTRLEQAVVAAEISMKNTREEFERKLHVVETELTQEKRVKSDLVQKLKGVEDAYKEAANDKCKLQQDLNELQGRASCSASRLTEQEILVKELKDKMTDFTQKLKESEKLTQKSENEKCKLQQDLKELQGRANRSASRLTEQETLVKELKDKMTDITRKLKESEKLKQDTENDKCKLQQELEELQGRASVFYSRLAEQEILVKELKGERTDLTQKLKESEKLTQNSENEKCKLQQELEELQGRASGSSSRLAEQEILVKELKDERNDLIQKLKDSEKAKQDDENDKCKLQQEMEQIQGRASEFASRLAENEILVKELTDERAALTQKLKESEKLTQNSENDKCKLQEELEELQGRASGSASRLAEQEILVKELKDDRNDLIQKLKDSEKAKQDEENDKCKLKSELEELQDMVSRCTSELERLQILVKELEDTNISIRTDNLRLERQCAAYDTVKSKLEELQERVSGSTTRLAEQEIFVKELKDEKNDLVQKLKESEKAKQDAEDGKDKIKSELEELQDRISGSASKLAEQEILMKKLKDEKNDLVQKLKEAEKAKQDAENDKNKIKSELEELQDRISGSASRLAEQEILVKELKDERDDMVGKLKEAEKSKKHAEDDRCKYKQKLEKLEESVGISTSELEKLEMLVKELKDTNISTRTENLRLERQCTKYVSELEETVKASGDRERDLVKRNAELKKEVEDLSCTRDKYNELCMTVKEKDGIENKYQEAKAQLIGMETKEKDIKAQNLKLEEKISEIESQNLTLEAKISEKEREIKKLREELKEMTIRCDDMEEQLRRRAWEVDYAKTVNDVKKEQQEIMEKRLAEGESAREEHITKLQDKVDSLQISMTEKMGEVSDLIEKLADAETEKVLAETKRRQVVQSLQETQLRLAHAEEELAGVSREKRNLSRQMKYLESTKDYAERKAKKFKLQVAKMQQDSYESEREKEELRDTVSEKVWQLTLMLDEKERIEDTVMKAKQELSALIKMGTQTKRVDAEKKEDPEGNEKNEEAQCPAQNS